MCREPRPRSSSSAAPAVVIFIFALGLAATALADERVDGFRARVEKWVETRQILSEEQSEWEVDRESLRATRNLLKDQKQALEAAIQDLKESETVADEERRELLLERGARQRANQALAERIVLMEQEVLALAPLFPQPLQDKLEPLLVQIPSDPATTRLQIGQRLMSVLGVLAQAEKFNGTATFVGETRSVDGGPKIQVRTLYWGLGQAIYVDSQGRTAGIGRPGDEGWDFTNDPALAEQAKLLLDIYEGNVDAIDFVQLPAAVQER